MSFFFGLYVFVLYSTSTHSQHNFSYSSALALSAALAQRKVRVTQKNKLTLEWAFALFSALTFYYLSIFIFYSFPFSFLFSFTRFLYASPRLRSSQVLCKYKKREITWPNRCFHISRNKMHLNNLFLRTQFNFEQRKVVLHSHSLSWQCI